MVLAPSSGTRRHGQEPETVPAFGTDAARLGRALREARPRWGTKDLAAAEQKLEAVGIRSVVALAQALEGEVLNKQLRSAGLKAFGSDTCAALRASLFTSEAAQPLESAGEEAPAAQPEAPVIAEQAEEAPSSEALVAFDVVHHAMGRLEPRTEAKRVAFIPKGRTVRGCVANGWLKLGKASAEEAGVSDRDCWVLIDATALGHGILLEPHDPTRPREEQVGEKPKDRDKGDPPERKPKDEGDPTERERARLARRGSRKRASERAAVARSADPFLLCDAFGGIQYGEWFKILTPFSKHRMPFAMLQGALSREVLHYLLEPEPFNSMSLNLSMLQDTYGLETEGNKAGEPDSLAKADWHTRLALPRRAQVFVPRAGRTGPAARAPPRIIAFAEAFRDVNVEVWEVLAERLRSLGASADEDLEGLCDLICEALEQGRHFGAVELQLFSGEGFEGRRHVDGVTSLLHLAVTLAGERELSLVSAAEELGVSLEDTTPMRTGDVYLSSPSLFQHKVDYPTCDRGWPMLSMHMRLLFEPRWWLKKWVNQQRDKDMADVALVLAQTLLNRPIRLPSLAEVRSCETRVMAQLARSS